MSALAKCFDFIFFPLQVETLATREGVGLAMDTGLHNLIIECDSLQIVNALNDSSPNMLTVGHNVENSNDLLLQSTGALVAHTHHQANGIAHRLAQYALHNASPIFSWFEEPPDFIFGLLVNDCYDPGHYP